MERTPHVLIAGEGAWALATEYGLPEVRDPDTYYQPVEERCLLPARAMGTVGAVVLDQYGDLAAATSTGGVKSKTPGRVGDTPLIGAGTWADERCAISCTGLGEYFIRAAAAADVPARICHSKCRSAFLNCDSTPRSLELRREGSGQRMRRVSSSL